ncbi:MAG: TIGR00282 family metallophosphoesterase [bacterium]
MKILFLGDIMGRVGREAIKHFVPQLKEKHKADLVIANVENLAHGKSATEKTLQEIKEAGVEVFTSGNHVFKKQDVYELLEKEDIVIPANYPEGVSGKRYLVKEIGAYRLFIANLMGRVFIKEDFTCPFIKMDELLEDAKKEGANIILVDLHAEASSEKMAFFLEFRKKVGAILGTHTHVASQDFAVYDGCAFVSDVGMVGGFPSVIGVNEENVIKEFRNQTPQKFEMADTKWAEFNAVLIDFDGTSGRAKKIEKIREFIDIENGKNSKKTPKIE